MQKPSPHPNYLAVAAAAEQSFRENRDLRFLSDELITLARLYCYGFRGQIIGAFHATRQALENLPPALAGGDGIRSICEDLTTLGRLSLEMVPTDFRAILTLFHRYHRVLTKVVDAFERITDDADSEPLREISHHFSAAMMRVVASSGIVLARDNELPPQASFIVPSLGITIVPLVYGDQHSWNLAFLSGKHLDVPRHLHRDGIEIHLGFQPLEGETCLGGYRAKVTEGYAMPIPPGTPHGYLNTSGHEHMLPFIFGSRRLGGWGIFPDVDPQPIEAQKLQRVDVLAPEMNGTVLIDREIEKAVQSTATARRTLISAEQTHSPRSGGLSLSIASIVDTGLSCHPARFRIVSVVRGRGVVTLGPVRQEIFEHDHFGIPSGVEAVITRTGDGPLVVLDAILEEKPPSPSA